VNVAAFASDTDDEIVVATATGGRMTFRNAGKTRRRGVEAAWDGDLGAGWRAHANYTWLDAYFVDDLTTGTPPVVVPSGNKLPGVPQSAAYAELAWAPPSLPWLEVGGEVQYQSKLYVNDRNTDAAPAWTVLNLRAGVTHVVAGWTLRAFVRVNNVTDRDYAGSVIVGDTNGRYFEPAPGRNVFAGASAHARF
jgi:iron complex outermembrane receptor protein